MIKKVIVYKYNIDLDDVRKDFFKIRKIMNIWIRCKLIKYFYIFFKYLDYLVEDI